MSFLRFGPSRHRVKPVQFQGAGDVSAPQGGVGSDRHALSLCHGFLRLRVERIPSALNDCSKSSAHECGSQRKRRDVLLELLLVCERYLCKCGQRLETPGMLYTPAMVQHCSSLERQGTPLFYRRDLTYICRAARKYEHHEIGPCICHKRH